MIIFETQSRLLVIRRKLKIATKNGPQRGKKDDYNHERKEESKSKQTQT